MIAEHFDGSLKTLRQRTPFRPFTVELISGNRFEVDYPDALVVWLQNCRALLTAMKCPCEEIDRRLEYFT